MTIDDDTRNRPQSYQLNVLTAGNTRLIHPRKPETPLGITLDTRSCSTRVRSSTPTSGRRTRHGSTPCRGIGRTRARIPTSTTPGGHQPPTPCRDRDASTRDRPASMVMVSWSQSLTCLVPPLVGLGSNPSDPTRIDLTQEKHRPAHTGTLARCPAVRTSLSRAVPAGPGKSPATIGT